MSQRFVIQDHRVAPFKTFGNFQRFTRKELGPCRINPPIKKQQTNGTQEQTVQLKLEEINILIRKMQHKRDENNTMS